MPRVLRAAALLSALVLSGACTRPYAVPLIEPVGLGDAAPSAEFGGLEQLGTATVLWTHGMCDPGADWADRRLELLAAALGTAAPPIAGEAVPGTAARILRARVVRAAGAGGPALDLDVRMLVWSGIVAPARDALARPPGDGPARARLNRELQDGLMNGCIVDAVSYLGRAGDDVRRAALHAVCEAYGGRPGPGGGCAADLGAPPRPVAIVSESLGSKVLFDAVRTLAGTEGTDGRVAGRIGGTSKIFMVSNQIPLLDSSDAAAAEAVALQEGAERPEPRDPTGLAAVLRVIRERAAPGDIRMQAIALPLVVAFSDPNDLLSYPLDARHVGRAAAQLVNVYVSNSDTLLGLAQEPLSAHTGYARNCAVLSIIARGHRPGSDGGPAPGLPDACR